MPSSSSNSGRSGGAGGRVMRRTDCNTKGSMVALPVSRRRTKALGRQRSDLDPIPCCAPASTCFSAASQSSAAPSDDGSTAATTPGQRVIAHMGVSTSATGCTSAAHRCYSPRTALLGNITPARSFYSIDDLPPSLLPSAPPTDLDGLGRLISHISLQPLRLPLQAVVVLRGTATARLQVA